MGLSLSDRLARVLPTGCRFLVHHLSTPPTSCPALYAAPPGASNEITYCESHFLSVSIDTDGRELQVFGIEILIYTTEYLTTLFVSKADSTGYLYLLNLPTGTPSPLKIISTTFLQYLIEDRKRPDRRLVLSLFARAQNQYLFPGSIENSRKHVLDDRGLIRWWCKVIDPLIECQEENPGLPSSERQNHETANRTGSKGYLKVPGCDTHETRTFLPKEERTRSTEKCRWHVSDSLTELGRSPDLPERCLVPRFPDDPKARFVEQLDDELPDDDVQSPQTQLTAGAIRKQGTGRWRSVKTLEQFWDMMSFRQECSSGRLVGFLWATFRPNDSSQHDSADHGIEPSTSFDSDKVALPTPQVLQDAGFPALPPQSPLRSSPPPERPTTPLQPAYTPSQRTPDPTPQKAKEAAIQSLPERTEYYYWPISSRGGVILQQKDYQRIGKTLLRCDYAKKEDALESSREWVSDVAESAGVKSWGQVVVGTVDVKSEVAANGHVESSNVLSAGLLRKKKRPAEGMHSDNSVPAPVVKASDISVLANGLVRKRPKIENHHEELSARD